MNSTHLEHIVIAWAIQFVLWPLFGPWAAGAVAVAVFLGREIAQHEYALALERGWSWGQEPPVGWYEGLLHGWTLDSTLDVLAPTVGCALLALLISRLT